MDYKEGIAKMDKVVLKSNILDELIDDIKIEEMNILDEFIDTWELTPNIKKLFQLSSSYYQSKYCDYILDEVHNCCTQLDINVMAKIAIPFAREGLEYCTADGEEWGDVVYEYVDDYGDYRWTKEEVKDLYVNGEIEKVEETIYDYIHSLISNDGIINPDALTDQEKKEFFMYSYSLIKHLFPKATESLYPIRIEEISTFDMLDDLGKWVEDHGNDLLPYLKRFRRHEETKQGYNVELFQVYSLIASIGYGVRILTDSYGDKWAIAVNGIRAARIEMKKCRFVNIPDIVENAYQFSITYQPKDKNKYIIKLLLDMGLSRNAIKKLSLPIKGDDKTSKESYDNIVFPLLPIDLEE
jgi:hypothetical protein